MNDFTSFRFGNYSSKDLHLVVVSSSSRYEKNLLPDPSDTTESVPGGDGKYYFGQTFNERTFSLNVAFDSVSEPIFRKISQLFATDKEQDLVFDELPYKTYRAKLKSAPDFKFVCFDGRDGQRVYKGEGTLNFIAYFPYAYGFDKYVVRAADYYKCTMPQHILDHSLEDNPYKKKQRPKFLQGLIKDHYNVTPNMSTPWKGGFPSIEQVQWGELYFNGENGRQLLIDERDYWRNIPEWQGTAKLLTTPTLDYDRELIYMPQYSKLNYYNMDTGLNKQNNMIGTRVLVYNPGDVPIDFELKMGNLSSQFRGNLDGYTFRVSRYNVERLTIEQAVDWTYMKTYDGNDEEYKYGTHYFTIAEPGSNNNYANLSDLLNEISDNVKNGKVGKDAIPTDIDWDYEPTYRHLKKSHPEHAYIVEPIPREKLGYFIRLFYWQSKNLNDGYSEKILDIEEGKAYADRYEELYAGCQTEEEQYELYWITLKEAILDKYNEVNEWIINHGLKDMKIFSKEYRYSDFLYDYINNPPEYIRGREDLKYGQFMFNIGRLPDYYTFDYFDINSDNFDSIPAGNCGCDECYCNENVHRPLIEPLYLDTEKRMLYNINDPTWKSDRTKAGLDWQEDTTDYMDNFFNFKPTKEIMNDNIERGHWFKLPPGWSLIDIRPVVDEDVWGGKRWLDGRPFDWGSTSEVFRAWFNEVYKAAADEYLALNCPQEVIDKYAEIYGDPGESYDDKKVFFSNLELYQEEEYMQFRRWYSDSTYEEMNEVYQGAHKGPNGENRDWKNSIFGLGFEIHKRRVESAEYGFLKLLDLYWRMNNIDENNQPIGTVDDWWWFASDYIWANFPPLYWGYADLLNQIQIKYTPLFY